MATMTSRKKSTKKSTKMTRSPPQTDQLERLNERHTPMSPAGAHARHAQRPAIIGTTINVQMTFVARSYFSYCIGRKLTSIITNRVPPPIPPSTESRFIVLSAPSSSASSALSAASESAARRYSSAARYACAICL